MAVWITVLVIVLALAAIGYTQGVIKVAFSTLGLIVAGFLAMPLGGLIHPMFKKAAGNPALMYVLSPIIAFAVVNVIFKVIGFAVAQKVDTYFKYKVPELRQKMYQRLSDRAGLVLSILNSLGYVIFLAIVVEVVGYPAVQFSSGETDGPELQKIVQATEALEKTKLNEVAASFDPTPAKYYQAVDVGGMVYHNPLLMGKLARYPALLGIMEKDEYRAIANDAELNEKFQQQPPIRALTGQEKVQVVLTNIELVAELATNDFKDIKKYLETGETTKFGDETIIGRWQFDLGSTMVAVKKENPKITRQIAAFVEKAIGSNVPSATLTATLDKDVIVRINKANGQEVHRGKWENVSSGRYRVSGIENVLGAELNVEPDRITSHVQLRKDAKVPAVWEREM